MSEQHEQPKPLAGIRVLDLTRILAGPFGTMLLADLGADVIKVEQPGRGDDTRHFGPPFVKGESTYFQSINRGKRSITIDLKAREGQDVVRALIAECDVLVENFRPGVLARLGFDYDTVHELNPRMIYTSISGYGHIGLPEYAQAPGYDLLIQSVSGIASVTGHPSAPPSKAGVSIGDLVAGLYAVQGILAALYERKTTGQGRRVDIAMLDGLTSLLTYQATAYLLAGKVPGRMGNQHPSICPFETLRASDGHLVICCGNDAQFRRLAAALGRPELCEDPRFVSNGDRVSNRPALIEILEAVLAAHPVAYWLEKLSAPAVGMPVGAIHSVDQTLAHPQLVARGMVTEIDHPVLGRIPAVGCPIRLGEEPCFDPRPAPALGEHTAEILAELGL